MKSLQFIGMILGFFWIIPFISLKIIFNSPLYLPILVAVIFGSMRLHEKGRDFWKI